MPRNRRELLVELGMGCVALAVCPIRADDRPARAFATVIEVDVEGWITEELFPGREYGAGRIAYNEGNVELILTSGTVMTVRGPADFELKSAMTATVARGEVEFHTPPSAKGFRVEAGGRTFTAESSASFTVTVDENGKATLKVTEGKVVEEPVPGRRDAVSPSMDHDHSNLLVGMALVGAVGTVGFGAPMFVYHNWWLALGIAGVWLAAAAIYLAVFDLRARRLFAFVIGFAVLDIVPVAIFLTAQTGRPPIMLYAQGFFVAPFGLSLVIYGLTGKVRRIAWARWGPATPNPSDEADESSPPR